MVERTEAEKRKIGQLAARQYVSLLLTAQDMPEWPYETGLFSTDDAIANNAFMDELVSIGNRIERSITDAGRALLRAKESSND